MFNIIKGYLNKFKIYAGIALFLLSFFFGGYLVYKFQQPTINKLRMEQKACHDANASNKAAIKTLRDDVGKANKRCAEQLNIANRTIRELNQIDNLKGGTSDEKMDAVTNGDAVLLALNKLFDRPDHQD